jgi:hypothetical protein
MTLPAIYSQGPRRRGDIYCSPWCGGNCKYADYVKAKEFAAKLCKELGRGWKPHVWENLGWHYEAVSPSGRIKVSPSFGSGYHVGIGEPNCPGSRWNGNGSTPTEAILAAFNFVLSAKRELNHIYNDLMDKNDLNGKRSSRQSQGKSKARTGSVRKKGRAKGARAKKAKV